VRAIRLGLLVGLVVTMSAACGAATGVTPPPTDTLTAATPPAGGSDGWRMILAIVAFALVGTLVFTTPNPARRRG